MLNKVQVSRMTFIWPWGFELGLRLEKVQLQFIETNVDIRCRLQLSKRQKSPGYK